MIKGRVDRIDNHKIRGWCFDPSKPKERLTVELFIDGIKIKKVKADVFRVDLEKRKNIPANCAFDISLPQSIEYKGQKIEVLSEKTPIKSRFSVLLGEKNNERINRIQIYGERASGTNFLKQLLVKNIPNIAHTSQYGWKHFFPPKDFPNSDNCLFIVIYRDPFDWLRSLHLQPHHTHPSLKKISFSKFIRTEWQCVWDELADVQPGDEKYGTEMLFERDPLTGKRFENVIQLRNAKNIAFEELKQKVKNIEFVKYEELKKNPKRLINKIKKRFKISSLDNILTVDTYKGITKKKYIPKEYAPIDDNDLLFIKNNLKTSLEKKIGYDAKYQKHNQSKIKLSKIISTIKQSTYSTFENIIAREKKPKLSISKQTPKKKLFIHIGMPKTGSSALQAFLLLNTQKLEELGIHYPANQTFGQAFQTSSGNAYKLSKLYAFQNTEEINKFFYENITQNKITVLSSEALYHTFKTDPSFFFKSLEEYDYKIICYVRRQDDAYQSIINQRVKNHNLILNKRVFNNPIGSNYGDTLFNALNFTQKERIIVRPYEKSQFVGGSIFSDFLNCINIKWDDNFDMPEKHVNPSLNAVSLYFRSFLNEIGIDRNKWNEKVIWNEILQKYSVSKSFGKPFLDHGLLNTKQRIKVINDNSIQNEKLARVFLNREDGILFIEPLPTNIDNEEISFNKPNNNEYNELLDFIYKNDRALFSKLAEFLFYLNCIENKKTNNSIFFEKIIRDNFMVLDEYDPEKITHKKITIKKDCHSEYIETTNMMRPLNKENDYLTYRSAEDKITLNIDLQLEQNLSKKQEIKYEESAIETEAYIICLSCSCSKQTKVSLMYQTTQNSLYTNDQSYKYHLNQGDNNIKFVISANHLNGKLKLCFENAPITININHININLFKHN